MAELDDQMQSMKQGKEGKKQKQNPMKDVEAAEKMRTA